MGLRDLFRKKNKGLENYEKVVEMSSVVTGFKTKLDKLKVGYIQLKNNMKENKDVRGVEQVFEENRAQFQAMAERLHEAAESKIVEFENECSKMNGKMNLSNISTMSGPLGQASKLVADLMGVSKEIEEFKNVISADAVKKAEQNEEENQPMGPQ